MKEKAAKCRKVQTTESFRRYEIFGKEKEGAKQLRYRFVEDDNSIYEYDINCLSEAKKKL